MKTNSKEKLKFDGIRNMKKNDLTPFTFTISIKVVPHLYTVALKLITHQSTAYTLKSSNVQTEVLPMCPWSLI